MSAKMQEARWEHPDQFNSLHFTLSKSSSFWDYCRKFRL